MTSRRLNPTAIAIVTGLLFIGTAVLAQDGDSGRGDYGRGESGRSAWRSRRGSDGGSRGRDSRPSESRDSSSVETRSSRSDGGSVRSGESARERGEERHADDSHSDHASSHESVSPARKAVSAEAKGRSRVTVELPSLYVAVDADHDGQLGLYEWKKARRPYAEFTKIDANGDGFLVPTELLKADRGGSALPANIASSSKDSGSSKPTGTARVSSATVASSESSETLDESSVIVKQARNSFDILDGNHDGHVSLEEWTRAAKTKPLFEAAGVDLSQPMSRDQFVMHFVRLKSPKTKA
jgi:hypothetical protein